MKKSILLLLTTLLVLPLWAQSRYSVYKIKGAVQICPKGQNTWAEPARKQDLQLGDRLQLGEQSAITILDSSNSLLYTYAVICRILSIRSWKEERWMNSFCDARVALKFVSA